MKKNKTKLKTIRLEAQQDIVYSFLVKARTKKQAYDKVYAGEVDFGYNDVVDSGEFIINDVTEEK